MNEPFPTPGYVEIFRSQRTAVGEEEYRRTAQHVEQLATRQPGLLGFHSAQNPDGSGITVSYWRSLVDIRRWKQSPEHLAAQQLGKTRWYADYHIDIARIKKGHPGEPSCSSAC